MTVSFSASSPVYARDPEKDLTTQAIASRYGISVIAAGNWCRKGHLAHAYRAPVQRGNGLVGLEWRVPEASLAEFTPPNPKGGRPSQQMPAGHDVVEPASVVLPEGVYKGWTLGEAWAADADYVRGVAWGHGVRSALQEFVSGQAQAFLAGKGEAPPPATAPDTSARGERVHVVEGTEAVLFVDVDEVGARLLLVSGAVAVAHVLPHLDGRVLGLELATGRLEEPFYDYGGQEGLFTALAVQDKGESVRYPISLQVRQGAGRPGPEGMRPDEALTSLSLPLSRMEAKRLGVALSDFLLLRLLRSALVRE